MKTVLLCGGLGTRLSEETTLKPKPMVHVGDHPILWHIMNTYAGNGFNDFVLALGYKGEVIKNHFLNFFALNSDFEINLKDGNINYLNKSKVDWNVSLIDTGLNTMTGGRVARLRPLLENEGTFMLTYGDGVSNVDLKKLVEFHKSHGKLATVTAVRPPSRFGEIVIDDKNQVKSFAEKPQTGQGWINGGYFVFNTEVFKYLGDDSTILERDPLENIARDGQLMTFKHEGFWQCMDTLRDKNYLNQLWEGGDAPWVVRN